MKQIIRIALAFLFAHAAAIAQELPSGKFIKRYWFENGVEHGNPNFNSRLRVNAPETVLHPSFGKRVEARGNGMVQILVEEDLTQIDTAFLYAELWGGHPGTVNKQVIINGRSTYAIPEVGTERHHCTYHYPMVPLKITDLVNGYNVLQFNCENGTTFWGHFLIDNACLVLALKRGHAGVAEAGLQQFEAQVSAKGISPDAIALQLQSAGLDLTQIDKVQYFGFYEGFDDNGNGLEHDWHGYTKHRKFQNILGESDKPPFKVVWNTAMLTAQNNVKVRAEIHFKNDTSISYITPEAANLEIPVRQKSRIDRFLSNDMPAPFWSRANRLKTCTIYANINPARIERAELHILIWDGGEGQVKDHFKFNGRSFPLTSGKHKHDVLYRIVEIDPSLIKAGANTIELLSDTEHHGIEVLLPGPELIIKSRQ